VAARALGKCERTAAVGEGGGKAEERGRRGKAEETREKRRELGRAGRRGAARAEGGRTDSGRDTRIGRSSEKGGPRRQEEVRVRDKVGGPREHEGGWRKDGCTRSSGGLRTVPQAAMKVATMLADGYVAGAVTKETWQEPERSQSCFFGAVVP
jgi:hypothetical protein